MSVSFAAFLRPGMMEDTAAPMGLSTAAAAAAMGDPTAEAVAARRPGAAMDRDVDAPTSAAGTGTAPTAACAMPVPLPTRRPSLSHAPGLPSFFRSISFSALANLSSSASRICPPTRPMYFHASSPPTL